MNKDVTPNNYSTGFQQTTNYQVDGTTDRANPIPFQGMLNISLAVTTYTSYMRQFFSFCLPNCYSTLLVTCPVTSVKLQIANYLLLTANPIMVLEISLIGLAVSKK